MAEKKVTKKVNKKEVKEIIKDTSFKSVIISPRMTEKAVLAQEKDKGKGKVYTFNVEKDATKRDIFVSIRKDYKVTPIMVNTSIVPSKKKFSRGKWGVKGGGKKAYVYLKKGDKIDIA